MAFLSLVVDDFTTTFKVPIGVLLYNENKVDEMCKILDKLHDYVPSESTQEDITLPDGQTMTHKDYKLVKILLGGDQVTVKRVCGAKGVRSSHDTAKDRLEGVIPVVEDWQVLMKVSYNLIASAKVIVKLWA